MTTVLLAHSHPAMRAWIRDALAHAHDIELVVDAFDGGDAWNLLQQIRWDAALVAWSLTGLPNAMEIVTRAKGAAISRALVVIGAPDHDAALSQLWRAGIAGCLPDDAQPEVVVHGVQAAARGQRLWTESQVTRAQRWWDEVGSRVETLTERERQVLELVASALSDTEIARRLGVSVRTAQTHVSRVLGKLGVQTRQEAIVLVLSRGTGNVFKSKIGRSTDAPQSNWR